jgi:HEAT repeat protein
MAATKGRTIALASCLAALAVLVVSGMALLCRLQEEYWIWQCEQGDDVEQQLAARRLGDMRSARAVPCLLKLLVKRKITHTSEVYGDPRTSLGYREFDPQINKILASIGKGAVPGLLDALGREPRMRDSIEFVLGEIGEEAAEAIPALTERLSDKDFVVRSAARDALKKIRRE